MVEKDNSYYYFNSSNINQIKNQGETRDNNSFNIFRTDAKILYPETSIKNQTNNSSINPFKNLSSKDQDTNKSTIKVDSNLTNNYMKKENDIYNESYINNSTNIDINFKESISENTFTKDTPPKNISSTTNSKIEINKPKKSRSVTPLNKFNNNNLTDDEILSKMSDQIRNSIEDFFEICSSHRHFFHLKSDFTLSNLKQFGLTNAITELIENIMIYKSFEFMNDYNTNFYRNDKVIFNLIHFTKTGKENFTETYNFGIDRLKKIGKIKSFNLRSKFNTESFIDKDVQICSLKEEDNFKITFIFNFLNSLMKLGEFYFNSNKKRFQNTNENINRNINMFQTPTKHNNNIMNSNNKNKIEIDSKLLKEDKDPHKKYKIDEEYNPFQHLEPDNHKFNSEFSHFLESFSSIKIISINL